MEKFLNKLLNYRWLVMLSIIVVSAFFIVKMKDNTRMETNLDEYMPKDHPAFIYSDKAESWFNIKDGIIIALENKNGIFNSETLDTLKKLTKRFQKFEEIDKNDVTSLYTADNIIGSEDGMNYLNYVAGLDFSIGKVKLSGQFIQKYILDYDSLMLDDEINNMATFMARYDMFRETLHLELFSYIGLTGKDALIRPKISYDFDDSFSILLGANIFVGDSDGMFGRYQDNTMAYFKIKYAF